MLTPEEREELFAVLRSHVFAKEVAEKLAIGRLRWSSATTCDLERKTCAEAYAKWSKNSRKLLRPGRFKDDSNVAYGVEVGGFPSFAEYPRENAEWKPCGPFFIHREHGVTFLSHHSDLLWSLIKECFCLKDETRKVVI
jgi:hypothetical protein